MHHTSSPPSAFSVGRSLRPSRRGHHCASKRAALLVARAVLAVIILVFGCYFAYFVDTSITAYGKKVKLADAGLIGHMARMAVIAFISLIALDYLNIGGDLIRQSFLIVLAGVMLALGLAFGLGGRELAPPSQ